MASGNHRVYSDFGIVPTLENTDPVQVVQPHESENLWSLSFKLLTVNLNPKFSGSDACYNYDR